MSRRFAGLDEAMAGRLAAIALGHVTRTYPTSMQLRLDGPEDLGTPDRLTPIFHGSFDWHSCVHGYWTLARLLRLFPAHEQAEATKALFARVLTPANAADEFAFLVRPSNASFERPYGWGWLLKLVAELHRSDDEEARHAGHALLPLAELIASRFMTYLPKLTYAVRTGVHSNTAFALILAFDFAEAFADAKLRDIIGVRARAWFETDIDCPAWGEPSGEDFLSPSLCQALLMQRVLKAQEFEDWLAGFFPTLMAGEPAALFSPASVSDRSDGRIAHLDGLNLSRAWCWRGIAAAAPRAETGLHQAADAHLTASLKHVAGDYMGEHWLASFALLALSEHGALAA